MVFKILPFPMANDGFILTGSLLRKDQYPRIVRKHDKEATLRIGNILQRPSKCYKGCLRVLLTRKKFL